MTPEEMKEEAAAGAADILAEGNTERARALAARMTGDIDDVALTVSEGAFVVAWLGSTLIGSLLPLQQQVLLMTAVANVSIHMHHTKPSSLLAQLPAAGQA